MTRLVNGVFQGGGAKGVAYTGALEALHDHGVWFGSVAGASAGAITASMIAAGYGPDELQAAIPDALAAAKVPIAPRLGLAVLGRTTSLFEGDGLRRWLDDMYARKVGAGADRPVTFRQLHRASRIELYVLALDLATGLPVVFSRRTTPDVEVAGAVVASSAIPGAFPAGRAVFEIGGTHTRVHQLVDGGAWANYPIFVFNDGDFRCFLRGEAELERPWDDDEDAAWEAESTRPVVGFVLGEAEPLEHRNSIGFVPLDGPDIDRRFDLGPAYTSRKRASYLFGALLSSDWARLVVGVSLVIWISFAVATLPVAFRRFSTWLAGWMPDPLYPAALIGLLTAVVMALTIIVLLVALVMAISRLLADTLLPTMNAIVGIPLEVPPWVGFGVDSVLIRVPREGLSSIDFEVDKAISDRAVAAARASVAEQLAGDAGARLDALFEGGRPEPAAYRRGERPLPVDDAVTSSVWFVAGVSVVVTVLVGALTWWATNSAATQGIGLIMLAVLVAIVATLAAFGYLGDQTRHRASRRATLGLANDRAGWSPRLMAGAGVALLLAGIVVSVVAMADRSETTVRAEVVEAIDGGSSNEYRVRALDGEVDDDLVVTSDRHLRLGEAVFVDPGADGARTELVGALDDVRFAVAIVLLALGLGVLTSAERTRRWQARCRRLDEVTSGWARRKTAE